MMYAASDAVLRPETLLEKPNSQDLLGMWSYSILQSLFGTMPMVCYNPLLGGGGGGGGEGGGGDYQI